MKKTNLLIIPIILILLAGCKKEDMMSYTYKPVGAQFIIETDVQYRLTNEPIEFTILAMNELEHVETIKWDFGDGTVVIGDSFTITHTYTQKSEYTISLTLSNKEYTDTTIQQISILNFY